MMLEQSFIFLDRMTLDGEQRIWDSGISNWNQFLSTTKVDGISTARKHFYNRQIKMMQMKVASEDWESIARLLPRSEHWRLYDTLKNSSLALDIETSGYYGDITVVGLHTGETHFLIQGKNMSALEMARALRGVGIMLTFNGLSFDIPVLARRFPSLKQRLRQIPHIDMRYVCARLGYIGGLKSIEIVHGLNRGHELESMDGGDAMMLWSLYVSDQDEEALRLLLEYNRADTENLITLADLLIPQLWERLRKTLKVAISA